MKLKAFTLFLRPAGALATVGFALLAPSLANAQTTFTWGAPTTGTWQSGVAFGAAANYVNDLTLATGSIANFGSLSAATAASVNGTVEAYQLKHFTAQGLTLNAGTGTPLIRLGAGGISQSASSAALVINAGIEVTTAQAWGLTAVNTFSGVISGSGNLSIGTGTSRGLTWSNAGNTYNGVITVTAGQLFTTQTLGFQSATLDTTGAASTTTFRFNKATNTIGGLQGNVGLLLSTKNSSTEGTDRGGMTLSIGNNNSDTSFSGNITQGASASAITKIGSGKLTLSGTNSYTGATNVNGGTLLVNGLHSFTTGGTGYTVTNAGSTLGGSGRLAINGSVSVGNTAILAPGASIGTLTLDGVNTSTNVLTMVSGSKFGFELDGSGGTPDQLAFWNYVSGDLTLNSNTIDLSLLGTKAAGTYNVDIFKFFGDAGITGATHAFASGLTIGSLLGTDISSASIDWNGTGDNNQAIALTYTVVPEPRAALLGGLGMLLLLRRHRKS